MEVVGDQIVCRCEDSQRILIRQRNAKGAGGGHNPKENQRRFIWE